MTGWTKMKVLLWCYSISGEGDGTSRWPLSIKAEKSHGRVSYLIFRRQPAGHQALRCARCLPLHFHLFDRFKVRNQKHSPDAPFCKTSLSTAAQVILESSVSTRRFLRSISRSISDAMVERKDVEWTKFLCSNLRFLEACIITLTRTENNKSTG